MGRAPGIPRAKLAVAEHGRTVAVVLAVVGLVALTGAGWVYTNPPTTTVTDRTHEQTIESSLDTSAVVTGDSALYDAGSRVENQPVYFSETTPELTLSVETAVPDEQSVRVRQRVTLVMWATHDGEVFWDRTRTLVDVETVTDSGGANASATLDVPALRDRLAPVAAEVGSAGSISVDVELTTTYETDRYSGTLTRQRPLGLSDRTYTLDPFAVETTEGTTETRTVTVPRDPIVYGAPAALGAAALFSSLPLYGLSRRHREEWLALEPRIHRNRYAEWISVGSLEGTVGQRSVSMASVEDVVDVAIDTDKRVVHDRELGVHAVIDGATVYYHGPIDPSSEWSDPSVSTSADGSPDDRAGDAES